MLFLWGWVLTFINLAEWFGLPTNISFSYMKQFQSPRLNENISTIVYLIVVQIAYDKHARNIKEVNKH